MSPEQKNNSAFWGKPWGIWIVVLGLSVGLYVVRPKRNVPISYQELFWRYEAGQAVELSSEPPTDTVEAAAYWALRLLQGTLTEPPMAKIAQLRTYAQQKPEVYVFLARLAFETQQKDRLTQYLPYLTGVERSYVEALKAVLDNQMQRACSLWRQALPQTKPYQAPAFQKRIQQSC
ncbi:MAG: hypothetical protein ACUVRD_01035 [Bacteroidia bacterium]